MVENFEDYVKNRSDGLLVVGDVHGDYDSFMRAYDYAVKENLFFVSLGDLVDRGPKPYEVVKAMHDIVYEGYGAFVVGNHDDKLYRYAKGAAVTLSSDTKKTIEDVGSDRLGDFFEMYTNMIDTPKFAGVYLRFGNITLVHAASHPEMWEGTEKLSKTAKARALVGEVNGEKYPDGYPVRLYNWVNAVKSGQTVIVGHDMRPMLSKDPIAEPMQVKGTAGGTVIFTDTGCGKGGHLSAVVVMLERGKDYNVSNFVSFA